MQACTAEPPPNSFLTPCQAPALNALCHRWQEAAGRGLLRHRRLEDVRRAPPRQQPGEAPPLTPSRPVVTPAAGRVGPQPAASLARGGAVPDPIVPSAAGRGRPRPAAMPAPGGACPRSAAPPRTAPCRWTEEASALAPSRQHLHRTTCHRLRELPARARPGHRTGYAYPRPARANEPLVSL